MKKRKSLPPKFQVWIDARKKHHLSHAKIQMARELGLNPKKFGKIDNHKQETWKDPLGVFIAKLYQKSFGKIQPVDVKSIEEIFKAKQEKKSIKKAIKQNSSLPEDNSDTNNLEITTSLVTCNHSPLEL